MASIQAMSLLRELRISAGLSQAALAELAGVSRQLVTAAEAGRHMPRVDAALSLAHALGVDVAELFGAPGPSVDIATGRLGSGGAVRVGRVGELMVTAPAVLSAEGWGAADGEIVDGALTMHTRLTPGPVIVGCEPGLALVESILRSKGIGAVCVSASTAVARAALEGGRAHAAVVHGPGVDAPDPTQVERYHLTGWAVGLAAPADRTGAWWKHARAGREPVVQRETGAGVQQSFLAVVEEGATVSGPIAGSHIEAVMYTHAAGLPSVTIEPAARAVGAAFHAIDAHRSELWVDTKWSGSRVMAGAIEVIGSRRFVRRLDMVGGYDLEGCGERI